MPVIIAIVAVIIIVFLYVGTGLLNDKAGIPEGCEQAYQDAQNCEACGAAGSDACSLNSDSKFQEALEFMKEVKL